ncbi:ABC transporter ATP-binding protein [Granulosicoccus antarcticus]|uniref:Daunorubicin/doxorubicin resistance ATP-binding protein DrrA n=1 Tax=Granulosicoccus antarcticus IMCC3135 TaxID=1192854 RepID=A0A2Z2NN05_9GAMM|nr:ABC transporter ATP-binding protein [Granulosicoccus antarcticus]ASJ72766.1 Daunorubicin/doxorubicin resistance ATP-binding protein DrrA [Granulosicoccus antarcticus IMCC3135]
MIRIDKLCKKYGKKKALDDLCLEIKGNTIFGLLGPNGAGKTTLISVLNGLTTFDSGEVSVFDKALSKNIREIRRRCSLIPQSLAFYDKLSVKENLDYFSAIQKISPADVKKNISYAVEVNRLGSMLTQKASTLSGGQKRRLNIAIGLLNNPDILFLDEPTVGIDLESRNEILEMIRSFKQQNKCVIYTSHYMPEIEKICDQVAIINDGHIVKQGSIETMLEDESNNQVMIEIYETPLAVLQECSEKFSLLTVLDSQRLQLASKSTNDVSQSISVLEGNGVKIKRINYVTSTLESVFVNLTSRGI